MISPNDYLTTVMRNFDKLRGMSDQISKAADICINSVGTGGKVIFCGNGGSAADSQHLAAELIGRFVIDRNPIPALALTVDTSALTAISNDFGYEEAFARQLHGIGRKGDVLIGLSTSGTSRNVVRAFETAHELGIVRIAMTGETDSPMSAMADLSLQMPSRICSHIQEMHIAVGHIICGIVEKDSCSDRQ